MSIIVRNLSEQLVDLVRERILTGDVSPDRPIRQDALAAEFGVSKIPLREALARLEQEGLLASQANRGFTVRPLNAREAEEVYALRLKLEPEMIALAARNATEVDQRAASDILDTLESTTDSRGAGVGAFNRAFHMALLRPQIREQILVRRNRDWTDQITDMMRLGATPFVAVGAAHLAGDDSVQSMLEARGYTVTRLQ